MSPPEPRMFPMMGGPPVPWSVAELIYEKYAATHGRSQTIERIAERGGFGWAEVEHIWKGRRADPPKSMGGWTPPAGPK